jgi:hypothetical protein
MSSGPARPPVIGVDRPVTLAQDLSKLSFENEDMALYELYRAQFAAGRVRIDGVTFRNCRIVGPAVMLVLDGTTFDTTNFGDARGDIGNLLLRPLRAIAVGTIPVANCRFIGCEFFNLGFTGPEAVIDDLLSISGAS